MSYLHRYGFGGGSVLPVRPHSLVHEALEAPAIEIFPDVDVPLLSTAEPIAAPIDTKRNELTTQSRLAFTHHATGLVDPAAFYR